MTSAHHPPGTRDVPFRIAIVGAGLITANSHLPAALSLPGVELVALVDPVVDRAAGLLRDYGSSAVAVASVEAIRAPLDGAVIATPNDTHCEIAVHLVRRGISVLIEKPLANSVAEGKQIVDEAAAHGAKVAVGYVSRFRASTDLLKDALASGEFGTATRFRYQFGTAGGWSPLSAYIMSTASAGGGVLVVSGTHFLDRMLFTWGYPTTAMLEDDSAGGPEANCRATFTFETMHGILRGEALFSKTTPMRAGLIVETTKGLLRLWDSDDAEIEWMPSSNPSLKLILRSRSVPIARPSTFATQLSNFVHAHTRGEPLRVDGQQGLLSLRLIEQLYRSRSPMTANHLKAA